MKKINLMVSCILLQCIAVMSQTPVTQWSFNHGNAKDEGLLEINGTATNVDFYRGMDCDTGAWFNGATSGINFGNNLNTVFTDGTFSITLWAKPYSWVSADENKDRSMLIQKWYTSNDEANCFILYLSAFCANDTTLYFTPIELNIWSHIAVIGESGNVKVFINGNLVASGDGLTFNSTTYPLMLGTLHNNRYKYNGGIDDVRIYNQALTDDQLMQVIAENKLKGQYIYRNIELFKKQSVMLGVDLVEGYNYKWSNGSVDSKILVTANTALTPKTYTLEIKSDETCTYIDTTTVKWVQLSDSLKAFWSLNDSLELSKNVTINKAMVDSGIGCTNAFYFDGYDSYISFGDTLNNIFTGSDFTISVWAYIKDTFDLDIGNYPMILSKWNSSPLEDNAFILWINHFSFGKPLKTGEYHRIYWQMPDTNKWHHYAVVRKGLLTMIYLNSNLVGSAYGYYFNNTTFPLVIGALHNNNYNLKGRIDDLRIYNRALSVNQVEYLNKIGYVQNLGVIPSIIEVDQNGSITLDAGEGFDSYLWSDGEITQMHPFVDITDNMLDYNVLTIDNEGCYTDTFDIIVRSPNRLVDIESVNTIIWPNPANNLVNMNFHGDVAMNIQILDINGRVLKFLPEVNKDRVTLDLSGLSNGIYLLKVRFTDKTEIFRIMLE
ncbi:MAG: T9SS type A sorting domain-containing protein [Bacteroidales bacterium]|nr:T9SS type A sorting domain-containing protein [Bacteroidales bacterium]